MMDVTSQSASATHRGRNRDATLKPPTQGACDQERTSAGSRIGSDEACREAVVFHLGEWVINPAIRRVNRGSEVVRLSPKAMGVLSALHAARGGVVTRAELLDEVWPNVTVGEEVLTHAIAEIRKALGDSSRDPRYLETVHKSGYRLLLDRPAQDVSSAVLDLELHAAYLDACELFFLGGRRNVGLAADAFTGILDRNPGHALAWAGLAKSLFFLDRYFGMSGDNRRQTERCAREAVALEPNSPEAHAVLGFVLAASGQHAEAFDSFATSIKLNPHLAETHYLVGRACLAAGDYRMAATMLEHAAALRPDDFHSLLLAAKARRYLQDTPRERSDLVKASLRANAKLDLDPKDRRALCDKLCCMVELGAAGDGAEAAADLVRDPDPNHYYLVGALARAGETGLALDCMETVVAAGWSHGAWLAHDLDVDDLRQEPRFRRLATEIRTE